MSALELGEEEDETGRKVREKAKYWGLHDQTSALPVRMHRYVFGRVNRLCSRNDHQEQQAVKSRTIRISYLRPKAEETGRLESLPISSSLRYLASIALYSAM